MGCGRKIGEFDCCTVVNEDCVEALPRVPSELIDAIITDPPYGAAYVSNMSATKAGVPISNDGARLSLRLYKKLAPQIKATHMLWFTRWDAWPDVWEILGQWLPLRGLLVWDKGDCPGMGDLKHWGTSYELVASFGAGKIRGKRDASVLRFKGVPPLNRNHPTEKPVELLSYLVQKMTDEGQLVVDLFSGSGTTLVAAKKLGRHYLGFEISPEYCDTARRRLDELDAQPSLFEPKPNNSHS